MDCRRASATPIPPGRICATPDTAQGENWDCKARPDVGALASLVGESLKNEALKRVKTEVGEKLQNSLKGLFKK